MTQEQAIRRISDIIKNGNNDDLMYINNGYQSEVNGDNYIYRMNDFDEIMGGEIAPSELACRIFYGDFNPNHDFFWYDGYGNLQSSDYVSDCPYVGEDDIAEWCVEHDEDFEDWRIRDVLDEYNENEEEEE